MIRLSLSNRLESERETGKKNNWNDHDEERERARATTEGWPKASNNEAYIWPTSFAHLLAKQLVTGRYRRSSIRPSCTQAPE